MQSYLRRRDQLFVPLPSAQQQQKHRVALPDTPAGLGRFGVAEGLNFT